MRLFIVCIAILLVQLSVQQVYLHNPRGSNNRLNTPSTTVTTPNRLFNSQNSRRGGYHWAPPLYYHEGSRVPIQWTMEQGCGKKNPFVECQVIIQYMCGDEVRDGVEDTPIPNNNNFNNQVVGTSVPDRYYSTMTEVYRYGMHESKEYFKLCESRERNNGLYSGDININNNRATSTRQNPGGNRHGFECQEERDYYPYWHPSPWRDIAIYTDDVTRCGYYRSQSFNVRDKNLCSIDAINNKEECLKANGDWQTISSHGIDAPECLPSPMEDGKHTYWWQVPKESSDHCVIRIRYNITSTDFDGWNTFSDRNGVDSPVQDLPNFLYGDTLLTLAVFTSRIGRTYEDRSHEFAMRNVPKGISRQSRIWNINVMGKRGTFDQAFPALPYEFVPMEVEVVVGDYLHFQWTGSDYNPTSYAGQGIPGTDRSNLVLMEDSGRNYPLLLNESNFFDSDAKANRFANLSQEGCGTLLQLIANNGPDRSNWNGDPLNCFILNRADRYFDGKLMRIETRHSGNNYAFMSSRNNLFSSRAQKGLIRVLSSPHFSPFAIFAIGLVVLVVAIVVIVPIAMLAPTLLFVIITSISQRI